jgi:hypothetical protein
MLLHLHPIVTVFTIPLILAAVLLFLPYLNYDLDSRGIWFVSQTGRRMAVVAAITALIVAPLLIIIDEFIIDPSNWFARLPPEIRNGLIPVVILLAAVTGFYLIMKWHFSSSNNEALQAMMVLLVVAFVVLTVTGIWFRGPGMALTWLGGN